MNRFDTEPIRRVGASLLQWGGWAASIGLGIYSIQFHPEKGEFAPQWVGLAFVFAIGLAITGSLVRSRMRLSHTILSAFKAGRSAQRDETGERVNEVVKRQDEILTELAAYVRAQEVRADVAQRQQEILDRLALMEKERKD